MPSKGRWTLNPRKWFGTISNAAHKRDRKSQTNNTGESLSSATTQTISSTSLAPRILTGKNKTKVTPITSINENISTNSTNALASFTQFQLPAFNVRRERTSTLLPSSTLFHRTNTFIPTRTEPSIRKSIQYNEELSIDATRWSTHIIVNDTSKLLLSPSLSSQYENFPQKNSIKKQTEINTLNISDQCLVDYPHNSTNNFIEKSLSTTRTRSSSSIDDNDEHDESSSSGIFTDERADLNEHHRTASKDTLSTLEVLSIESIADSQISLNHGQSHASTHHYRLPILTFEETINNKSIELQHQTPIIHSHRARSAEGNLKDNPINTPIITRNRQASAAIVKKIEKRLPTSRSPPVTLEKVGFKRIANDTYRLTIEKNDHLYRRQRQDSIIHYSNYDDSLPPANDEESYATLPRTSSTEQLNNNLQDDLRAIVDDYLRPMIASVNKTNYRSPKAHHRSKRSHTNSEHMQINIEDITDKLLSSIDCSTYAQYQRCY